jgi:hypothetical protein
MNNSHETNVFSRIIAYILAVLLLALVVVVLYLWHTPPRVVNSRKQENSEKLIVSYAASDKSPGISRAKSTSSNTTIEVNNSTDLPSELIVEPAKETSNMEILLSEAKDHIQKAGKCLEDSLFVAFQSPHKSKALIHQQKKQLELAIQLCQTVVEMSPKTPESAKARLLTADAFARLQKPRELVNEQIELAFEDDAESAKEAVYGEHLEKTVNDLKSIKKMFTFLANTNSKRIGLPSTNLGQSFKGDLENMITDSELIRIFGSDYSKINQGVESSLLEGVLVE